MYAILVVGKPKAGKTYTAHKLVEKFNGYVSVYDINNEPCWKEYDAVHGLLPDEYIEYIKGVSGCHVFEDATGFLDTRSKNGPLNKMLIAKRHEPKQIFIFLFHALSQVPKWVKTSVDMIYLGRTNDTPQDVKTWGFPELDDAFKEIRDDKKTPYKFKLIKLT